MKKQVFALAALFVVTQFANAAPISGTLGLTGPGVIAFLTGGNSYVDFCPRDSNSPAYSGCPVASTGTGILQYSGGSEDFEPIPFGSQGTILDITDGANPPAFANFTVLPIGVPHMIDNFLTLNERPNWNFQVNTLEACQGEGCLGAVKLTQNPGSVTVSVEFRGTLYDEEGISATWIALVTGNYTQTQFDTVNEVISAATSPGGAFTNSWSLSLTATPIPEPSALILIGSALLLGPISLRYRRKK